MYIYINTPHIHTLSITIQVIYDLVTTNLDVSGYLQKYNRNNNLYINNI